MYRLIARLMLVFLLAGIFVPVGMAISAPLPHACCARKTMHRHDWTAAKSGPLTGRIEVAVLRLRRLIGSSWGRELLREPGIFRPTSRPARIQFYAAIAPILSGPSAALRSASNLI